MSDSKRIRILVVDDEEVIVSLLEQFFEDEGHSADVAKNGNEALKLVEGNSYDLILTDHDMPEMTGVEFVRRVRENDKVTRIVMISGYPNMEEFVAKSIGADEYLSKPLKLDELSRIVSEVVDRKNAEN